MGSSPINSARLGEVGVGQAFRAAVVLVGELFVVESQLVQQRGVQVVPLNAFVLLSARQPVTVVAMSRHRSKRTRWEIQQ